MKRNLLKSFDLEIKPGLLGVLKQDDPDSEAEISQHLSIIHASILAGLVQKSKKRDGSKTIKNLLELGNHTGEVIDQIPEVLENEKKSSDLKKLGNSLLSFVFEEGTETALEKIKHFLSQKYQAGEEELIEMNRLTIPFSMGLVGRVVHGEQLTSDSLAELLEFNEPLIVEKYPGLAQIMGLHRATASVPVEPEDEKDPAPQETPEAISNGAEKSKNEDQRKETEAFFNALWPWVIVLIISGLTLYIMKNFTGEPPVTDQENIPPPSLSDTLEATEDTLDIIPVEEEEMEVSTQSTLDSLMKYLESHENIPDTIEVENTVISFQDSTSTLTISANNELTGLVAILQAYPQINVGIEMTYDSSFYKNHAPIIQNRMNNLSNYFQAFGLDNSRYDIRSKVEDLGTSPGSDTRDSATEEAVLIASEIELFFYQHQISTVDPLKNQ